MGGEFEFIAISVWESRSQLQKLLHINIPPHMSHLVCFYVR